MSQNLLRYILGYVVGGLMFLILIPSGLFCASMYLDHLLPIQLIPFPVPRFIISSVLLVTGLVFGFWSGVIQNTKGEGGPLEFVNVEISPKTRKLVVTGPYRYTRNPMLFGACTLYYGVAIHLNSTAAVIIATLFMIFMLIFVKSTEERRLLKDFGNEYEAYRQEVSMFIPWPRKSSNRSINR